MSNRRRTHLQTDCFNVYYYHLQKPIDRRRCENGSSLGYILVSLLGIVHLADHCSYFGRGQAHKQKLANSWSQILKWLNVIFDGHFFHGDEENWFTAVDGIFRALNSVGGEALDEDDAFEFAVDIWNGFRAPDGREYFSAMPLFQCLTRNIDDITRIDYLLQGHRKSIELLVNKILSRLKHAIFHYSLSRKIRNPGLRSRPNHPSSPTEAQTFQLLVFLMERLNDLHQSLKATSIFSPTTGSVLVSATIALLGVTSPSVNHVWAARLSLITIHHCMVLGHVYARNIVEAGVLFLLLKVASFDTIVDPDSESGFANASNILMEVHRYLIYDDVVAACQRGLRDLIAPNLQPGPDDLLKTSQEKFQVLWKISNGVLLEQVVLLRLFKAGYATESGRCASVSTYKQYQTLRRAIIESSPSLHAADY